MHWLVNREVVVSLPQWRSLAPGLRSPAPRYNSFAPSRLLLINGHIQWISCFKDRKVLSRGSKATRKRKAPNYVLDDRDISHILWWKERMDMCRKPSTIQLVKRLEYSNLLGLDVNLKSGSLKEGTLNWEMLQFKSRVPREVLLCRVGDFYEAVGIDACVLVEYAGLNPFGGLQSDSIPRAGCRVVNLQQTLDDLTLNGYSVCIVEEVQGPTQARTRKSRFISGNISLCKGLLHKFSLRDRENIFFRGWFDRRCSSHKASHLSVPPFISAYIFEAEFFRFSLSSLNCHFTWNPKIL